MASWLARPTTKQATEPPSTHTAYPSVKPTIPAIAPVPWPPNATRPLSDIREITEPSLMNLTSRLSNAQLRDKASVSRAGSARHNDSMRYHGSIKRSESTAPQGSVKRAKSFSGEGAKQGDDRFLKPHDAISSSSYSSSPEQSGCYAVPLGSVPRRSSSFGHTQQHAHSYVQRPATRAGNTAVSIANRGQGRSPVKEAVLRLDPVTAGTSRRLPSRTFVRCPAPIDILDSPNHKHPRLKLDLQVSAPISVGGGTVEGHVKVTIDDNERLKQRRTLGIGTISIDLLGYEEVSGGRKASFLALGTDIVDAQHPPPLDMIEPANPLTAGDKFWTTSPSTSALPFLVSLPLDTGPPPFTSKHANIRFLLCATALIRDGGTHYRVRTTQEVQILPTYDPEKALTSLASPLTATDEIVLPKTGGFERLKLTAGLHRQVWVSGSTIFVDVHILNKTHKHLKKLDLNLERDILCYKHAAVETRERKTSQPRVFESNHQSTITTASIRAGSEGWNGVEPHASETKTCILEVPRGHATVRSGKYFEVRYFLTVSTSFSNSKVVSVQLPIILVHMNSLDVVPNSVAQVAAAIEERRAAERRQDRRTSAESRRRNHVPIRQRSASSPARSRDVRRQRSYTQGRAFAAPRQQSLDRQRADNADIDVLRHALDTSPRKQKPYLQGIALKKVGSNMSFASITTDSPFRAIGFRTLPTRSGAAPAPAPAEPGNGAAEGIESIRARKRRMGSFDTLHSKKSIFGPWHESTHAQSRHDNQRQGSRYDVPHDSQSRRHQAIAPHVLGLSSISRQPSFEVVGIDQRPATGQGFRERMDRSRFEFKAVRRKASGGMKDRSLGWLDNVRQKGKEREGWI
ncbi:hypothetical protein LTS10_003187 [Elasticomyces elasticus]|nr:hypothetical protein LTS10_003187 [Elasticomyces elasticus]